VTKAQQIVDEIIDDLTGRSGLDGAWCDIDADTQSAITEEWRRIVERHLRPAAETSVVLWAMHIPGPDDVWACASKEAAEKRATEHNDAIQKLGLAAQFGMQEESVLARVIEWPHSAESHAESLRDDVADTL
jgi:hypothetical protein